MEEYYPDDVEAVKTFFRKSEYTILDANYTKNNKKVILKLLDKDNNVQMLWFDMASGFGNQKTISKVFPLR